MALVVQTDGVTWVPALRAVGLSSLVKVTVGPFVVKGVALILGKGLRSLGLSRT